MITFEVAVKRVPIQGTPAMFSFYLSNYKITFDPEFGIEFLNHMWATEPVATTSICLTLVGLLLTLGFKLFDLWWDLYKERARQGRLKIELSAARTAQGQPILAAIISNTGREPIVIRDIGYARPRLLGTEFVPVTPIDSPLPRALNARDLVQLRVDESEANLELLAVTFRVKDSLGKIWEAPDAEIRKARRLLRGLPKSRTSGPVTVAEEFVSTTP